MTRMTPIFESVLSLYSGEHIRCLALINDLSLTIQFDSNLTVGKCLGTFLMATSSGVVLQIWDW